jgi:hypothetical protein
MTKDAALRIALDILEYEGPSWLEARQPAITAIKAALEQDEPPRTGQPYHWTADAMQSAINIERENCARLCDAYELPDVAQAIRSRSHQ